MEHSIPIAWEPQASQATGLPYFTIRWLPAVAGPESTVVEHPTAVGMGHPIPIGDEYSSPMISATPAREHSIPVASDPQANEATGSADQPLVASQ